MPNSEDDEAAGVTSAGMTCVRPDFVALRGMDIDVETISSRWVTTLDYGVQVDVACAVLQFERFAERVGVFDAVAEVGQLWKAGQIRFEDAMIGDLAAVDVLYTAVRRGERLATTERAELFGRVHSGDFEQAWRLLLLAIRECLRTCCDGDGWCGSAPVAGVVLAAERLHGILGRTIGEYETQLATELSCQLDEAVAVLESEAVTAASDFGPGLANTLEWLDRLAGRPNRDRFTDVAIAQALGGIFTFVGAPVVDETDEDSRLAYRSMIERSSVLFPATALKPRSRAGAGRG